MRLTLLSLAACLVGSVPWACSSDDTDPFSNPSRGGAGGAETGGGGSSGATTGGATSGSTSGGSNSGGDGTGGTSNGGTTGDGGVGAEAGGTAIGGTSGVTGGAGASGATAGDGGKGGSAGTPAGGAGTGGSGGVGGGKAGSGGMPGNCTDDDDCDADEYCKKTSCDAASGNCTERGPDCLGATAAFDPICGCDGITYWNTCAIEHEGESVASKGECTGNDCPTCSRDEGGDSCPVRDHARCYRPVEECSTTSPSMGVCWVLPSECPPNEAQTTLYCGGTAGSARCIGFCEVLEVENSFQRDARQCED